MEKARGTREEGRKREVKGKEREKRRV